MELNEFPKQGKGKEGGWEAEAKSEGDNSGELFKYLRGVNSLAFRKPIQSQ